MQAQHWLNRKGWHTAEFLVLLGLEEAESSDSESYHEVCTASKKHDLDGTDGICRAVNNNKHSEHDVPNATDGSRIVTTDHDLSFSAANEAESRIKSKLGNSQ